MARKSKPKYFEDCDVRFSIFPNMDKATRKVLEDFYRKLHGEDLSYKPKQEKEVK